MVERVYVVSNFNSVSADKQVNVAITTGEEFSVKAVVPENLRDYFVVSREGNRLVISNKNVSLKINNKEKEPVIYVTMPALGAVDASGQSVVRVSGGVTSDFRVTASGQSDVEFKSALSVSSLVAQGSQQSDIDFGNVTAGSFVAKTIGQSDVNMDELVVRGNARISVSAQSSVDFEKIQAAGNVDMDASGQASIDGKHLSAKGGEVSASGQSSIKVKHTQGAFNSSSSQQASCSLKR